MLAERYLRSRYAKGKEEGLREGRDKGREEGREKERNQWLAWNQRREEALREGREFTESPPGDTQNATK